MASTQAGKAVNMIAGEDLNGDLYEALTVNASGQVVKVTAATDVIVGFLAEDPGRTTAAGTDTVPVAIVGGGGVLNAKAGAAITAGQIVVSHGATTVGTVAGVTGLAGLAADIMGAGIALEAATAAGDIIAVLAMPLAGANS